MRRLLPILLLLAAAPTVEAGDWHRGVEALENEHHEAAYYIFLRSAQKGDARSAHALGTLYLHGMGTDKDLDEAARWLRAAADAGLANSQAELAGMYARGEGVEQNPETAAFWFRKAAIQGHPVAQATLGVMAYKGEGTPHDMAESFMWMSLAAEQGLENALMNLQALEPQLSEDERAMGEARLRVYKRRMERRESQERVPLDAPDTPRLKAGQQ